MPNVCVEVRIRPSSRNILEFSGNKIVVGSKIFTFSKIHSKTTQSALFTSSIVPFIEKFLNGGNCSILVYGQTGSGKTYTMGLSHKYENGIIQNSLEMIFKKGLTLRCSFIEIYNEEIYDLMSDLRQPLSLRTSLESVNTPGEGTANSYNRMNIMHDINIIGLQEIPVSSFQEAVAMLKRGSENRTTKSTKMNSESSRSHAIFTVTCLQQINDQIVESKLTFVDLAGSERLKRSECTGKAAKEAININCGLLSLGNVINALYLNKSHVPFRDSKLTRILQKCLVGNTLLIACISGLQEDAFETTNTLKYASRAALISLNEKVHIENDKDKLVILNLKKEISRLKEENNRLRMQVMSKGMKDEGVLGHPLVAELMNRLRHYEGEVGVSQLIENMKAGEADTTVYINNGTGENKIKSVHGGTCENRPISSSARGAGGRISNSTRFENIKALMKSEKACSPLDCGASMASSNRSETQARPLDENFIIDLYASKDVSTNHQADCSFKLSLDRDPCSEQVNRDGNNPSEIFVNSINGNELSSHFHICDYANRVQSGASSIFEGKISLSHTGDRSIDALSSDTTGSQDTHQPNLNLAMSSSVLNGTPFNEANDKIHDGSSCYSNGSCTDSTNTIHTTHHLHGKIHDGSSCYSNDSCTDSTNTIHTTHHLHGKIHNPGNPFESTPNRVHDGNFPPTHTNAKRTRLVSFDLEPKSRNILFTPLKEIPSVQISLIDEFENYNAISLIKHSGRLYFNCIDSKIRMYDGSVHIVVSDDSIRCLFSYKNDLFYSSRSLLKVIVPNSRPLPVFAYKTEITALRISEDLIFTGHDDGTVNILDRKSNQMIFSEKVHKGTVFDILVLESGIFTCSRDHSVKFASSGVHEKMNNIYTYLHKSREEGKCMNFVTLSPPHYDTVSSLIPFKGKCISVSRDSSIKIWNNSIPFKTVPYAHDSWIKSATALDKFFVTGCKSGVLKCWNFVDHSIRCIGRIEVGFSINAITSFDGDVWISCQNKKIQRYSIR